MATLIPASKMTARDSQLWSDLLLSLETDWSIHSYLPFVSDSQIGTVVVATRKSDGSAYYVFRAYSHIADGGIEHSRKITTLDKAVAARFAVAEEVADVIYDNRKPS